VCGKLRLKPVENKGKFLQDGLKHHLPLSSRQVETASENAGLLGSKWRETNLRSKGLELQGDRLVVVRIDAEMFA
jgi:hypothetical protein